MKKRIDVMLVISSVVCLLPIVLGFVLYDKLPEQMAVHWDSFGNPDNFMTKAWAVFGMPVILAAVNVFVHFTLNNDPKKANASQLMRTIGKWSVPVIALMVEPITLFKAMGADISIETVVPALVGVLIVICGNYLPKCKQNFTVGIKLPWTLNSEDNWNRTHRAAGYVWIVGGLLMIVNVFLNLWFMTFVVIFLLIAIPFVHSYMLYKKGV